MKTSPSTVPAKASHTPGPWHLNLASICGASGLHVTAVEGYGMTKEQNEANREFIVTACNSHADLLAALEESLKQIEAVRLSGYITSETFDGSLQKTGNTIRSALARAKQGQS